MHATHAIDTKMLHWTTESRREDPPQADISENPMVEVNVVNNF